jgi:hypothetical protein
MLLVYFKEPTTQAWILYSVAQTATDAVQIGRDLVHLDYEVYFQENTNG